MIPAALPGHLSARQFSCAYGAKEQPAAALDGAPADAGRALEINKAEEPS
ncbi:MAG: hypothetical protein V8R75_05310 [Oscillospiraceae bacterium]